jgi:hypothetical protein
LLKVHEREQREIVEQALTVEARLLLQYLEPSPEADTVEPARLRDHLAFAFTQLPVTDLALGWSLRPEIIEAVRTVIPAGVSVWRWVPVFADSGEGREVDGMVATGPRGEAPSPFRDLSDFRLLCLDHDEVVEAGLERAVALARGIEADGLLLDRVRWHSPSASPSTELTCFCDRSREAAAGDGLDLRLVAGEAAEAAGTLEGRRSLVRALLGAPVRGPISEFLAWRSTRVTAAVSRVVAGLAEHGLRSALDVFTPALAPSVGQDLASLASLGEWSKSMTYFDALGPASMPFELRGYAAWLEAAGETDPASFLSGLLGFDPPGLSGSGAQIGALENEMGRLAGAVGPERAVVGIDAVEIPDVCEVDDGDLDERLSAIRAEGLGISPCWELLAISDRRIERLARLLRAS